MKTLKITFSLLMAASCIFNARAENLFPIMAEGNYPNPDRYSYINEKGQIIIKGPFCDAGKFHNGLAVTARICTNPKSSQSHEDIDLEFIDTTGNVIFTIRGNLFFDGTWPTFENGLINIDQQGKCGYVDRKGKVQIPFEFDSCQPFADNFGYVFKNRRWFFIDASGKEVQRFKFSFSYFRGCQEGVCLFNAKRKVFFYNLTTKKKIPGKFDFAGSFSGGIAPIMKGKKWGYIDLTGKAVIPPTYDYASPFSSGMAIVKRRNSEEYYFINRSRQKLHKGYFRTPFEPSNGLIYAQKDKLSYCYYNLQFEPIFCQKDLP